jgi:FkbM family methyltransferase
MKFFYGYDKDHYMDITHIVFQKCLKDDGIYIPAGDGARCEIVGTDPYPNILKHIMIKDHFGNEYFYYFTKEVNIKFDTLSIALSNHANPKIWWNNVGKFIMDPVEKLNTLQKHFNLKHKMWGGFEMEYPEQLMCMRHINENDRVLEIGGNIGRTSHIIQTILKNPLNHIVMEIDLEIAQKLRENLDLNKFTHLRIETAALSKSKLYNIDGNPRPVDKDKVTSDMKEQPTISYSEICSKYDVDFNVLVADCEGSLYYIFKEDPDMLNNIGTVIMENDYTELEHKQAVDSILKSKGFKMVYQEKGVPWASWSCCYEYFYEVWRK